MTEELGELTRAEIYQQPELWQTTVDDMCRADLPHFLLPGVPMVVTGAGTSAYAAAAVAHGIFRARAVASTDLLIDSSLLADAGMLLSLARSGDSPESVAVIEQLQRLAPAVRHLAITCNGSGRLANTAGVESIVLDSRTNDRSLVMTSSFTNLVLAGLCLEQGAELRRAIPAVQHRVNRQLPELDQIASALAKDLPSRVVCLASAPLFPLANEAALKVLEMTAGRIIPMAETFLGLRHGPMSFLDENTLVLGFLSSDPTRRSYEEDLLSELRQKGFGRLVLSQERSNSQAAQTVPMGAPDLPDVLRLPFEAPFAQLLAYHFSLSCGLNPDQPSPENVISRVVANFHIHQNERPTVTSSIRK